MHTDPYADGYCVMGNPIAHSRSPEIHIAFAQQTHQHISYQAILVEPGKLKEAIDKFRELGGKGINITVPFKVDAWEISAYRNCRAERALAVNTISFNKDGEIVGDNTDGIGFIRDLAVNHNVPIKGKSILILGAGGSVRGILPLLLDEQPDRVVIANRTPSRAVQLARLFGENNQIITCGFNSLANDSFDIVINAISSSLYGDMPTLPADILTADTCCYDLMYSRSDTVFLRWAKMHGATVTVDGLGMLVEQAAESFFIWRNIRPETNEIIRKLRGESQII